MLRYIIISMRPLQWIKNGLLFTGLIFSGHLFSLQYISISLRGFLLFCLGSGCIYIFNDVIDRKKDLKHPLKKNRPIASGDLNVSLASIAATFLLGLSFALSAVFLNTSFTIIFIFYIVLMLSYIFFLKNIIILDVLVVAIGFVCRALAGVLALNVEISPWLLVCTFLVSLLVLLGKRRHEVCTLGEQAFQHRKVLREYSLEFVDQMIAVVTSSTLVIYSLYTFSEQTIMRLHTKFMPVTIPFVCYGIFRYLYLVYQKKLGGSPEILFVKDSVFLTNIILWGVTSILCIYFLS